MAHEAWIESAARERKPVIASDIARSGQHLLYQPAGAAEEEARERDRARRYTLHGPIREACTPACVNPHHDTNPDACKHVFACANPDHRRPAEEADELLQALGLTPYVYAPGDADGLLCERCQQRKDPAEFSPNSRHTSRRAATCKACCANENGTR